MTTPDDLRERYENQIQQIVHTAVLATDMWALDNEPWRGTRAEHTRALVDNAVRHLIEQGLLDVPEDIDHVLSQPILISRQVH